MIIIWLGVEVSGRGFINLLLWLYLISLFGIFNSYQYVNDFFLYILYLDCIANQ